MWGRFLAERSWEEELVVQAASSGDLESLKSLEAELQNPEVGAVAAWYAAQHGHARIIQYLYSTVSAHVDFIPWLPNDHAMWNPDGPQMTSSPLHLAVKEGYLDVVNEILHFLQQRRLQEELLFERDALYVWFRGLVEWAVRWGNAPIVQRLLTPPLLVDSPIHEGSEKVSLPLHLAAHHNHLDVLNLLLQACRHDSPHFSLPDFSADGLTPLHVAAHSGSSPAVQLLLSEAKIDVNARSRPEFFTPLHMAANAGHVEVVTILLQNLTKHDQPVEAVPRSRCRLDLTARDCMGRTALHYAVREGHEDVVQKLLEGGDQIPGMGHSLASLADHDGLLPLHMAARAGHVGLLRRLRSSYGEGINRRARHSLHMKARVEMEYMQIERREANMYYGERWAFPRPRLVDSLFWKTEGFSPLQFAARYGHEAAMRELQLLTERNAWEASSDLMLNDAEEYIGLVKLAEAASSNNCRRKIEEEEKAMEELVHAWDEGTPPPLRVHVMRWLEDKDIGSVRIHWLRRAATRRNLGLLKRLIVVCAEFQAADHKNVEHEAARFGPQNDGVGEALKAAVIPFLISPNTQPNVNPDERRGLFRELLPQLQPGLKRAEAANLLSYALLHCPFHLGCEAVPRILLLLHPVSTRREVAFETLERALQERHYEAATEIVLQVPEVALVDNSLAELVQSHLRKYDRVWPADLQGSRIHTTKLRQRRQNFLMAVVTRAGLVSASTLLRAMLPWASKHELDDLVEVILDRPELKRGLYEDRQVYLDCANAILVGAALIAGVAFQGWLQPPLGYNFPYEGGEYAELQKPLVRTFWRFNNGAFFLAVGALIAGAKGAVPMARDIDIVKSVETVKRAVAMASTLLGMAMVCVVVAFTTAGFVVLPPLPADVRMMRSSVAWGATICGVALLWFVLSVLPLLDYYTRPARRLLGGLVAVPFLLILGITEWCTGIDVLPTAGFLDDIFLLEEGLELLGDCLDTCSTTLRRVWGVVKRLIMPISSWVANHIVG